VAADKVISANDREIIRGAAKRQLELANTEKNKERVRQWYLHNKLMGDKPLIYIEMPTFMQEVMPQRLLCEGEYARGLEARFRRHYLNQELLDDDFVTPDYFPVKLRRSFKLFGVDVVKTNVKNADGKKGLGHHFEAQLKDLEDDYHKLKVSEFKADMDATVKEKNDIEELIGDILPVEVNMGCLYSTPTQMLVHIMSMEDMLYNMMDYPDLFKEMMGRIADDTLAFFDYLEANGFILPTVRHDDLGNGSLCYTDELPSKTDRPLTTRDVWGFMDSQETIGISPQMFEEFIFPCYERISLRYGLFSYGCCEPVHAIWDNCLSKLGNLRKLSISPWCDEGIIGEKLRGGKMIYFRKPNPNHLGVDVSLNEDDVRTHINQTLTAARGCKLEFGVRDVLTVHGNLEKPRRYVEIVRQEIEKNWRG
jgi:hypothetical protein